MGGARGPARRRGEDGRLAAARELAEESDLQAARWDVLVDYFTTPGGSNEALRVFLARDLSPVPDDERFEREAEELDMELRWVPLDEALRGVLAGELHNPSAVVGILAAAASRAGGWASLRPADAPWPERRGANAPGGACRRPPAPVPVASWSVGSPLPDLVRSRAAGSTSSTRAPGSHDPSSWNRSTSLAPP